MKKDTPRYVVRLRGVLYFKRRGWPTRKFQTQELGEDFYAEYATILRGLAPKAFCAAIPFDGLVSEEQDAMRLKNHQYRSPITSWWNDCPSPVAIRLAARGEWQKTLASGQS